MVELRDSIIPEARIVPGNAGKADMYRNEYELTPPPGIDGRARLIRKREVCARVGFSMSELHRRIAAGTFPAPVRLGPKCRAVAFLEQEVDAYIAALVANREHGGVL